jgi:hypothetical protein
VAAGAVVGAGAGAAHAASINDAAISVLKRVIFFMCSSFSSMLPSV